MEDSIEDTVSMLFTVRMHGNDYKAAVALEAPIVTDIYQDLDDRIVSVMDHEAVAVRSLLGYAMEKDDNENDLIKKILVVSNGLYAYKLNQKLKAEAEQVRLTDSDFAVRRDTAIIPKCLGVFDILGDIFDPGLIPYGVVEAEVGSARAALTKYTDFMAAPLYQRAISSTHHDLMLAKVGEAMGQIELLDPVYETVKDVLEEAYLSYRKSRVKYDYSGASNTPPTVDTLIPPLSIYKALDLPYLETRRFLVHNYDPTDPLLFGSSTLEGSFTNTPRILQPGKSSGVLSATLGSNGNFLLIQNLSQDPIHVKIWVIEAE